MIQVSLSILVAGYLFMSKIIYEITFMCSNNSIEINLLECVEKEKFAFDKLDQCHHTETETATGRIGAALQDKAVKLLMRRR